MIVVPATEFPSSDIADSNMPANDYTLWSSATSYQVGDKVTRGDFNYEAAADNVDVDPAAETTLPKKWVNLGPVNRLRMFIKRVDNTWKPGTFTEYPDEIDITIDMSRRINAIGMVGVEATNVTIELIVGGDVIYTSSHQMTIRGAGSWYRYFFAPFQTESNLVQLDMPPIIGPYQLRIKAEATGGVARIGMVVFGLAQKIGNASWGSRVGFDNYSFTEEDSFGNVTVVPRGKKNWVELDVVVDTDRVPVLERTLSSLKDKAALYIGSRRVTPTIIVGKFDRFSLLLANSTLSEYTLELRSLA